MEHISHRYKVLPLPSANLVRFLKALGLGLLICQINITPTIYTTQISVRWIDVAILGKLRPYTNECYFYAYLSTNLSLEVSWS